LLGDTGTLNKLFLVGTSSANLTRFAVADVPWSRVQTNAEPYIRPGRDEKTQYQLDYPIDKSEFGRLGK